MDEGERTRWEQAFVAYHARFAGCFARSEARARSQRYLRGLLAPVERKNGWQVAEAVGDPHPIGIQRLLYEAVWEADQVRDLYQDFVVETFGDPAAVVVVDETGFLKKGTKSVGVQRQYSGTAGKVENCQLGVFLAYATARDHVLLDRRLYLPQGWADDPDRRVAAKVPEAVTFQTMPELALAMLEAVWARGVPHAWITADERYGGNPAFLAALEAQDARYVVAVPSTTPVWTEGTTVEPAGEALQILKTATPLPQPVATMVAGWAEAAWERLVVAAGAKGPRAHEWATVRVVASRDQWPGPTLWLLARRSLSDPTNLAYYFAHAPADTPLRTLAQVAAQRWPVEQCFEEAKGETGLDQYEVRRWPSWYRHITLSMLAHGFLAWQRREAGEKPAASGRVRVDRGVGPAERPGSAPAAGPHAAIAAALPGVPSGVVALAATTPRNREALPLLQTYNIRF